MTTTPEPAQRELAQLSRLAMDPQIAVAERATALLTAHQRMDAGSCLCGWGELGKSHPGHQADTLARAGLFVAADHPARLADDSGRAGPLRVYPDGVLPENMAEIDRNARAYGWEIGHGEDLAEVVDATDGNPFLNREWRNEIERNKGIDGGAEAS